MIDKIIVNEQNSITIKGKDIIYIDPFNLSESNLLKANYIFITHSHYDHFSKKDIDKIITKDTIFIMPKSMYKDALEINLNMNNIYFLDINQHIKINDYEIQSVESYNINKSFHPKDNKWLGYILTINNEVIYICGDTDYIEELTNIKCDIMFVPIGGTYTMNYKEASTLVNKINPKVVVPVHYGTIVGEKDLFDKFKDLIDKNIIVERKLMI